MRTRRSRSTPQLFGDWSPVLIANTRYLYHLVLFESLLVASLIDLDLRYEGFKIPDYYVVGYGLDYGEIYRNLPYIAVLKPEIFNNG